MTIIIETTRADKIQSRVIKQDPISQIIPSV
jgi:hypothetical protein